MDRRKLGNIRQVRSIMEVKFLSNREKDKECIIIHNENLEVMFNKDNALDIVYVKFNGINISFLSQNGLNNQNMNFAKNFEGGFLYTCGMDNVSNIIKDKPIHGSLHYTKAEDINIIEKEDYIEIKGNVRDSGLFEGNLVLKRDFKVYKDRIIIKDLVENLGYIDKNYVLLYHTNFGYPFLDEGLKILIPATKSEGLTKKAKDNFEDRYKIIEPIDGGEEDVYYHTLNEGDIRLRNEKLNIECNLKYDINTFPLTLEWKSMISGDYALGIEPTFTRFDTPTFRTIKKGEYKDYIIEINFKG